MGEAANAEDAMQRRIRQLERSVAALAKERDDLAKDVEQLCLSRGGHMFSSSYVASERLKFVESELKSHRQQLRTLTLERDNLQEDMCQVKAAKRQSDEGWQQERQHAAALQRELDFYKSSSVSAIAERDRAAFEVHSLKAELTTTAAALQESKSQLAVVQQLSQDLQTQVASLQQQLEAGQKEAAACRMQVEKEKRRHERHVHDLQLGLGQQLERAEAEAQEMQAELTAAQSARHQVESEAATLKATVAILQQEVTSTEAAAKDAEELAAQLKASNTELYKQQHKSLVEVRHLQTMLEQTSAALVAAQARLKETHAGHAGSTHGSPGRSLALQEEIAALKSQLADAEGQLQQAARDKLQVQLELSQAQAEEDQAEYTLLQLQQLYTQCKELLATATQQKVEALLQVADQEAQALTAQPQQLRQHLRRHRGAGSPASASPPSSPPQHETRPLTAPDSSSTEASHIQDGTPDARIPCLTDPGAHSSQVEPGECGQQQQQQQQQQTYQQLLRLLALTHHYVTLLQKLPAAGIAAAAEAGGSGGQAKKSPTAPPVPASDNALVKLAAAAQELDRDKQLLLADSTLKHQQLDDLLAMYLHKAGCTQPHGPTARGRHQSGSINPAKQATKALESLSKLLKPHSSARESASRIAAGDGVHDQLAHAGPSSSAFLQAPVLISSIATSFQGQSAAAFGGAGQGAAPAQQAAQGAASACAENPAADVDRRASTGAVCPGACAAACVGVVSDADVAGLHVALCHEVQQLTECGLAALRYIPKLTALSSLMKGGW